MTKRVVDIAASADLAEGETLKFTFEEKDAPGDGFVIRHKGRVYAWRNRCRHIPMTMDWVENRFLSRDGCHIQCATHGALFEIDSGLCTWGPPAGDSLEGFEAEEILGRILVSLPPV